MNTSFGKTRWKIISAIIAGIIALSSAYLSYIYSITIEIIKQILFQYIFIAALFFAIVFIVITNDGHEKSLISNKDVNFTEFSQVLTISLISLVLSVWEYIVVCFPLTDKNLLAGIFWIFIITTGLIFVTIFVIAIIAKSYLQSIS